ncbi:MATA-HMG [Gigaspora margarita]|uniref:MATA-HMG n=1 Tax=Gigaspora margarita TaxID=4874 RepID=A0A8H4A7M8_GIGMA|nr:MATA-HMG [Gigaspora margarita]
MSFSIQNYNEMTPKTVILNRPIIKVPSPFEFNISEFLPRKSIGCKTSNAFMIYRKVYVKTLLQLKLHSKMTNASCWAADSWKEESVEVKNDFKRFAKKLKEFYKHKSEVFETQRSRMIQNSEEITNEPLINDNEINLMSNELIPLENPIYSNEYVDMDQITQNDQLTPTYDMINYGQQDLFEQIYQFTDYISMPQDMNRYYVNMNLNINEFDYYDDLVPQYEIPFQIYEESTQLPSIFGSR